MSAPFTRPGREAGFTLFEVLVATVLMGMIFAALATVTAQWLPNWNRGMTRVQSAERLAFGLERVVADLSVAEFIPLNGPTKRPIFDGMELAVTFVRTAIGPNSRPGLEIVRLVERADRFGPALVRERANFVPMPDMTGVRFADPVIADNSAAASRDLRLFGRRWCMDADLAGRAAAAAPHPHHRS